MGVWGWDRVPSATPGVVLPPPGVNRGLFTLGDRYGDAASFDGVGVAEDVGPCSILLPGCGIISFNCGLLVAGATGLNLATPPGDDTPAAGEGRPWATAGTDTTGIRIRTPARAHLHARLRTARFYRGR